MLQYRTIEPGTLDVLKRLMGVSALSDFYLAGGTALSLYFGHRLSIDIDLFATSDFSTEDIANKLESEFPDFSYINAPNSVGLFGFIGDVKTDFVRHHFHKLIDTPVTEEGVRILSVKDIAAMKISAILKRAVKKDFWDIAELMKHYSVSDIIDFYTRKYPSQQLLISIPHALIYFDDAEDSEEPVSLNGQTWDEVKSTISSKIREYLS